MSTITCLKRPIWEAPLPRFWSWLRHSVLHGTWPSCFSILLLIGPIGAHPTAAFTPDSIEVRDAIDLAVGFLADKSDDRVGGKALSGLVFLKERQADHPRVAEAVRACVDYAGQPKLVEESAFYNLPLAIIFLSEHNPRGHRNVIQQLMSVMVRRQLPNGGWGYFASKVGDTSMSQYCVLAAWTAHTSGNRVPADMMDNGCRWLLRTQTPEGAWGYQSQDPGVGKPRVRQAGVRLSMVAAGLGSVYVCMDLFGLRDRREEVVGKPKIPDAFRPAGVRRARTLRQVGDRDLIQRMRRAAADGDSYMANNFEIAPNLQYPYYYLYALERYQSFRAVLNNRIEREPEWYNLGVTHLLDKQAEDGSWGTGENIVPSTAFATLFLLRSTMKSLAPTLDEGLLQGGRGLPTDFSQARLQNGRIVGARTASPIGEVIEALENPNYAHGELNFDSVVGPGGNIDDTEAARLSVLIEKGDYRVRKLAVTALASRRSFDDVPIFIYALSDQDDQVSLSARDALRFVSRKLAGFGMPDAPSESDKRSAVTAWKDWYRSVNPAAEFVDES